MPGGGGSRWQAVRTALSTRSLGMRSERLWPEPVAGLQGKDDRQIPPALASSDVGDVARPGAHGVIDAKAPLQDVRGLVRRWARSVVCGTNRPLRTPRRPSSRITGDGEASKCRAERRMRWRPGSRRVHSSFWVGPRVVVSAGSSRCGEIARTQARPRSFQVKDVAVENSGRLLAESPQRLLQITQINERTAWRRRERGALNAEESDRIARIARVSPRAIDSLGDECRAREWLKRSNRTLPDAAPLERLSTDAGSERVTDELGRIEYGDLY